LAFGLVLILVGVVQFFMRKAQGRYAHQTWKNLGATNLIKTPEFWANVSIPFNVLFALVGLGLIAASLVP
jgi:hypothetical protein